MIALILARYGLHIGVAAAALVAFMAWDASRVNKGRQIERQKIEKAADANTKKADRARADARKLPDDRLRDRHFRD